MKEIVFKDYKKMVDWFVSKNFSGLNTTEQEDLRGQGYLIFCEAVKSYDESRGHKFATHLFYCLKQLFRTAAKEVEYHNKLEFKDIREMTEYYFGEDLSFQSQGAIDEALVVNFEVFVEAMERVESSMTLSVDAQDVLAYILNYEWRIPGASYPGIKNVNKPSMASTVKSFKICFSWGCSRVQNAWEELRGWWANELFAHATV